MSATRRPILYLTTTVVVDFFFPPPLLKSCFIVRVHATHLVPVELPLYNHCYKQQGVWSSGRANSSRVWILVLMITLVEDVQILWPCILRISK